MFYVCSDWGGNCILPIVRTITFHAHSDKGRKMILPIVRMIVFRDWSDWGGKLSLWCFSVIWSAFKLILRSPSIVRHSLSVGEVFHRSTSQFDMISISIATAWSVAIEYTIASYVNYRWFCSQFRLYEADFWIFLHRSKFYVYWSWFPPVGLMNDEELSVLRPIDHSDNGRAGIWWQWLINSKSQLDDQLRSWFWHH